MAATLAPRSRLFISTNLAHTSSRVGTKIRAGINLNEQHKVSLVVSNLTNAEYSVRPLAIESPRLVNVVYTYEVH